MTAQSAAQDEPFRLEEATIGELHAAIKAGRTTCVAVVQHYIDRVRAYVLRTERGADGGPDPGGLRHDGLRSGLRAQRGPHALRDEAVGHADGDSAPGLPFSLVFRAEPGREDAVLRIASAYEAASRRRIPPPAFGPLPARAR